MTRTAVVAADLGVAEGDVDVLLEMLVAHEPELRGVDELLRTTP
jgi:hypothetical protein